MKIVSVIASPRRNGNCKHLVDIFTEQANKNSSSNKVYFVEDLNIKGCQACRACKNLEKPVECALDDDFNRIMDEVRECDVFIFAAPNYFGEICGQGRIFMDRFFSMTKTTLNQLQNSPDCIVIHTYGASMGHYDEYINRKANIFNSIGGNLLKVFSVGENKPTMGDSESLIIEVENFARSLFNKNP